MRRRLVVIAGCVLLVVVIGGVVTWRRADAPTVRMSVPEADCGGIRPNDGLDQLVVNRARWQQRGLRSYDYELGKEAGTGYVVPPTNVRVRDGEVLQPVHDPVWETSAKGIDFAIEGWFGFIDSELRQSRYDAITVTWDHEGYGHPVLITFDPACELGDDGFSITLANLRPQK